MLLLDSDNALGSRSGDVDDGLALAALLRSGLPVAGLASVGGNTGERRAAANNRRLGELCGYAGPYFRGARARDLGAGERRIHLEKDLWSGRQAPLRVAALGPLTNVAAALEEAARHREVPAELAVSEVVLVGGNASSRGRFPPWWPHEFNLTKDRAAAHRVLASGLPLTVVPLDVGRRLTVGRRDLDDLKGELGERLRRQSIRWLWRCRLLRASSTFAAFDLVAASYLIDPSGIEVEETRVRVHRNLWLEFGRGDRPVKVIRAFDRGALWERFVALVNRGPAAGSAAPSR